MKYKYLLLSECFISSFISDIVDLVTHFDEDSAILYFQIVPDFSKVISRLFDNKIVFISKENVFGRIVLAINKVMQSISMIPSLVTPTMKSLFALISAEYI